MESDRAVGVASLGSLALGTLLVLLLHVVPPTDEISPVWRTISQYALGPNKWIFDLGVLLIAAGSALAFAELARRRVVRPLSVPVVLGALWTLSLLAVIWFTKTDWTVGPSTGGTIHRYASVVGLVSLPVAVQLVAGTAFPASPGWRITARGLGVVPLACLGVLLAGVVRMAAGGGPWWRFVPLGLVERTMALGSVAAIVVVVLGLLVTAKSRDAVAVPA